MAEAPLSGRHLFLFGLGYVAGRLVPMAPAAGLRLSGTCRSLEAVAAWRARGVQAYRFDGETALPVDALAGVTDVLVSIPPDPNNPDPADRTACRALGPHAGLLPALRWAGFFSSTAVYGDHAGAWVDERGRCQPAGADAHARLRAEAEWRTFGNMTRTPVDILRLPGIYGPGRSALDQLRARRARRILKPGHVFNRIHADDIVACALAAMSRPDANGRTLNLSDDEPEAADVLLTHAATLLGVELPPAIAWDDPALPEMVRSFYAENRRIRNDRMKEALGVTLRYPTWREGLAAIAAEMALTDARSAGRWSLDTRNPKRAERSHEFHSATTRIHLKQTPLDRRDVLTKKQ